MSRPIAITSLSEEKFEEYLNACCDTLKRNKDILYRMYTDRTRCNDIIIKFPMRFDCVATIEIFSEKMVYADEKNIELDKIKGEE